MKDAITEARESMEFANAAPDSQWRTEFTAMAQAYAAIAQAEQLKRIADRLDSVCVDENGFGIVRTANVNW